MIKNPDILGDDFILLLNVQPSVAMVSVDGEPFRPATTGELVEITDKLDALIKESCDADSPN